MIDYLLLVVIGFAVFWLAVFTLVLTGRALDWNDARRDRARAYRARRRTLPCRCGCGRIVTLGHGWDGMHGA